jgi:hypothetical protein
MTHIHKTNLIHAPIEKVYPFSRDPQRWNDWWVGLSAPDEIKGNGEPGTIIKHHYKMAGINFPVTSTVLEDKFGPKESRWKGKFEGPIAGEHTWTYTAKGDETEVVLDLDYTVPGKALGRIADRLLLERLQEKAMDHTIENLKLLCEAEVPAPVR